MLEYQKDNKRFDGFIFAMMKTKVY